MPKNKVQHGGYTKGGGSKKYRDMLKEAGKPVVVRRPKRTKADPDEKAFWDELKR